MNVQYAIAQLAVLFDYAEEDWPSMDLAAEMLTHELQQSFPDLISVQAVQPVFKRCCTRVPLWGRSRSAFNSDRLYNRILGYPAHLRKHTKDACLFHIVDHSYAHLALGLPGKRTGVYCHDVDAFRCLTEPQSEPQSYMYRAYIRKILAGLQRASVVFHSTQAVRAEILKWQLVPAERLVFAPYGISAEFTVQPQAADLLPQQIQNLAPGFLLHVGSCIPRKRIDVLLDVFARVQAKRPGQVLVKVGCKWTDEQRVQIHRLGLREAVREVHGITRPEMAALYRRAGLLLHPSAAEGFGLPVIEALACGAPVLASDIPALREVGGAAAHYCPVGALEAWTDATLNLLEHPSQAPSYETRLNQAAKFSWRNHAEIILKAYLHLADA